MKKETTIAILFGIFLGALLAVFIITKNKEKQLETAKTIAPAAKISPSTAVSTTYQPLEILQPTDGAIVDKNLVTIKGKADKDALIILQSPIKDVVLQHKDKEFKVDFPLAYGENVIKINVYPKNNQIKPQEKEIKVYFLDE